MRTVFVFLLLLATVGIAVTLGQAGLLSGSQDPVWEDISEGLPKYALATALAFDSKDDNLVYAAVYYKHGIYRSEDGGETWQLADRGLEDAPVYALAASPTRALTVYAGAADGIYLSTDGARYWRRLPTPEIAIYALLIPQNAPGHIYAGSFGQVYVSKDGGKTWTPFSRGLGGVTLLSFVRDEESLDIIYAGTSGGGLLRTEDGGATWTRLLDTKAVVATVARARDGTILARAENRLLRSGDGGREWEDLGALPGGRRPLSLLAEPPARERIFAGSEGDGIFATADGGATWQPLGEGLARARVTAMAVNGSNPLKLVAGTPHGVFFSRDGGQHWERGKGIGRPIVRSLILDSAQGRLLAGTTDGIYERAMGSWQRLSRMRDETLVLSLALVPGKPEMLYAGTWGASVQRSVDGGQTWEISARGHFSQTIIPTLLLDPNNVNRLYARIEYDRLIVSDDGGDTWRASDVGLVGVTVFAVAAVPERTGLLYVGTDKGVYRSIDRGSTWSKTGKVPWTGSAFAVAVDPQAVDHLQVGTTAGVFHSRDGGQTWTAARGLEDISVVALTYSPVNARRGFAATRFNGVYQTEDGGITWRPFGRGLADVAVNVLVLDEEAKRLVAATEEGVFTIGLPYG